VGAIEGRHEFGALWEQIEQENNQEISVWIEWLLTEFFIKTIPPNVLDLSMTAIVMRLVLLFSV